MASSVQRRKVWLTLTTRVLCSNAAKTRNTLKFAGIPQTRQHISAASGPKFTISEHMCGRHCCLACFSRLSIRALVAKIESGNLVRWCADGEFLAIFASCISGSRVQHASDVHPKFALRPHHVWKYGIDIQPATAEGRRGKKKN